MTAAAERARARGAAAVYLWTTPANIRMRKMGAKLDASLVDDPVLVEQCRAMTGREQIVLRLDLDSGDAVGRLAAAQR